MSISDTWVNIKEYFTKWHKNDYKSLHTGETDKITNNTPDSDFLVKSKAVYDKVNEINTDINNINNRLDEKCNLNQIAQGSSISIRETQNNNRGLELDYHPVSAGLMTGKDQSYLRSTGMWIRRNNSDTDPVWPSVPYHSTVWVNPVLQLVYFYYDEPNCTKINNTLEWKTTDDPTGKQFYRIRPVAHIWGGTNTPGVHIGVSSNGIFNIKSDKTIKSFRLVGSLMWFYGPNDTSNTYK